MDIKIWTLTGTRSSLNYTNTTHGLCGIWKNTISALVVLTVSLEIVCCQTRKIKTQIKCLGTRFTYTHDDRTVDNIIFLNIINIIIKLYTYYVPTQDSYISCWYYVYWFIALTSATPWIQILWGLTGINELPADIIERQTITILLVWYCVLEYFSMKSTVVCAIIDRDHTQ